MEVTLLILPFNHSTSNSFSKNCILISSNINVETVNFRVFFYQYIITIWKILEDVTNCHMGQLMCL